MIGLLGGTFDPVHFGHLRPALEVQRQLALDEVRFLPCRQPPHRGQPAAAPAQRRAMLQRAIATQPGFVIDERELRRSGPSYMVDTLRDLRRELPHDALCLIMGMDAFIALDSWHEWRELIALAHLVVTRRPGCVSAHPQALAAALSAELGAMLDAHRVTDAAALRGRAAGGILFCDVTQLDISASQIRAQLSARTATPVRQVIRYLLPDDVIAYIEAENLYSQSVDC